MIVGLLIALVNIALGLLLSIWLVYGVTVWVLHGRRVITSEGVVVVAMLMLIWFGISGQFRF